MTTAMAAAAASAQSNVTSLPVIDVNATEGLTSIYMNYTIADLYAIHRPAIPIVNNYFTPLWYVIGFPGNLLAFIVWIQRRMRPSSGCYLAALAMADFWFLIFQMIFEIHDTWKHNMLNFPVICEVFPIFFLASQYLSPLLVLGFTVERYISICHPFQREKYCSTHRAVKVIIGLVVFSLSIHAIQGYFFTYKYEYEECDIRAEVTQGGTRSLWSVWSWVTELLVFGVVPLAILILNVLVITEARKLKLSEEKRLCLHKGHKSSGPSATTFMLLAVSFYLIFTTLPVTILYVLYFVFPPGNEYLTMDEIYTDSAWQRHFSYWTIRTVVTKLGISHYALNFYIYILTGHAFRKELRRLCGCKEKPNDMDWGSGNTGSSSVKNKLATNGKVAHV